MSGGETFIDAVDIHKGDVFEDEIRDALDSCNELVVLLTLDDPTAVVHVHVVQPDTVAAVMASIAAGKYLAESHYIPVSLAGLDELLDNLSLVCRLGSADQRESLEGWLEV